MNLEMLSITSAIKGEKSIFNQVEHISSSSHDMQYLLLLLQSICAPVTDM